MFRLYIQRNVYGNFALYGCFATLLGAMMHLHRFNYVDAYCLDKYDRRYSVSSFAEGIV